MDLRAARYDGRVVFTWRGRVGDEGRLGEAFEHGRTRVALAAARDLLADSEQRAAEEHELALRLQRAIMPADVRLVETSGVDIAVRCRPAKAGYLVAGDWYDALQLPDGELLFVVGDIAGHGIDAVTGMVAARNTLRGLAATGAGPGQAAEQAQLRGLPVHRGRHRNRDLRPLRPEDPAAALGAGRAPAARPRSRGTAPRCSRCRRACCSGWSSTPSTSRSRSS